MLLPRWGTWSGWQAWCVRSPQPRTRPPHCWAARVLDLDPIARLSRPIGRSFEKRPPVSSIASAKGIRGAPGDALLAERGGSFGLRQSLDTVDAFVGPLLAILLMWLLLPVAADVVLAFAPGIPAVAAGGALWGLHLGFTQGLLLALVADTSPPELRGIAFGVVNLLTGIALLVAASPPASCGTRPDRWEHSWPAAFWP
jgi:hypothetical protein